MTFFIMRHIASLFCLPPTFTGEVSDLSVSFQRTWAEMFRPCHGEFTAIESREPLQKRFLRPSMVVLLMLRGKCSPFKAKAAHSPGHLPAISSECPRLWRKRTFRTSAILCCWLSVTNGMIILLLRSFTNTNYIGKEDRKLLTFFVSSSTSALLGGFTLG